MNSFKNCGLAVVLSAAALIGSEAGAAVTLYQGRDAGAGPSDPRPTADAARDAFLAALGPSATPFTLTFEGVPIGYAPVLNFTTFQFSQVGTAATIAPGDTESTGVTKKTDIGFGDESKIIGYNTTPGGDTLLRFTPILDIGTAGAALTFISPIEYFGTFITGLGSAAGTLNAKFNNGTSQIIPITGGSGGGVQFFGFTSFGQPITSLDLVLDGVFGSRDIYALDDVITGLQPTFVNGGNTPVPIPSTMLLTTVALLAGGLLKRRGDRRRA
jgi:hypothetical protein